MSFCTWKLPYIYSKFKADKSISSRNRVISPNLLNKKFYVYNGKIWNIIFIKKMHLGFKFGEFSLSKKFFKKKSKKKNAKKKG
jgi:ribosomal protein S19